MIVEDQRSIREMLAVALGEMDDFEVVAEAGELDEALQMALRTRPEVVILDWIFPGGGGAGFLRAMQAHRVPAHVLVMSAATDEGTVREALTSGAKGYIEKVAGLDEFMTALRAVAGGGAFFGPVVAKIVERLVQAPVRGKRATRPGSAAAAPASANPSGAGYRPTRPEGQPGR